MKYCNNYSFTITRDIKGEQNIFREFFLPSNFTSREGEQKIFREISYRETLPLEGGKVALPPSNKGEQEIFRDDKRCNWIKNGIKAIFFM